MNAKQIEMTTLSKVLPGDVIITVDALFSKVTKVEIGEDVVHMEHERGKVNAWHGHPIGRVVNA